MDDPTLTRRTFLAGGGSALLLLGGCGAAGIGAGVGASGSASAYLAEVRAGSRLSPLVPDTRLEKAAMQQSGYMAGSGRMEHTTGFGRDFASRMSRNGIEAPAAENLAHGRMDLAKVFDMWMKSPPHLRNMVDPRMNRFGLASVRAGDGGQRYWTLVLAR